MRIMIEKQILDNINMYKDIKNMGIHGTTRPDKVHLSITICLNTMLKQGEKDNLRDERGVFTESLVLINSLIIPQPSALFYVMNHSSITKNPVHQIMGPSVRRDALNAQLDMVRDYGSVPQLIHVPFTETELQRPIYGPSRSKHGVSSMPVWKDDNKGLRAPVINNQLILTNTE
jgi:hypothetical protein